MSRLQIGGIDLSRTESYTRGMTESVSPAPTRNPALWFLAISGPLLILAGAIGALVAKGAAERAATGDSFSVVLSGGSLADAEFAGAHPDYMVVWVWLAVAGIGLVLGIVAIAIRAARR
jgi:hypothetical protein